MKVRKRILHIENHVQDRESVNKLFDKEISLFDVFHPGSVDRSPGEGTTIAEYLQLIHDERDKIDFIILDLGLTLEEEGEIGKWYASAVADFDVFVNKATGIRLLERIITKGLFPPERMAVYTQFDPKDDLFKNLTSLGKLLWDGAVVQAFYKNIQSDGRDLKEYVEKQCGARTAWIYYFSADFALRQRIEATIQALDEASDTTLVVGFPENQLGGAVDRYDMHYKEKRFRVALIDLVHSPADEQIIMDVQKTETWTDMLKLSTIPLIKTIEKVNRKTQIVALTNGRYKHGMVRALMDPGVGVDWMLNADVLDLNIFSTLWRSLRGERV